jgi:hypothetical protein
MGDTWPMLIAAGRLRKGQDVDAIARATGLSVAEVDAIAGRLERADERAASREGIRP